MEDTTNQAIVLLLNLPHPCLGGINLLSFTTTPRFYGIKNLPPGWHFVFTSSTSSLSVRHGAWFHPPVIISSTITPELFIKKWDSATETLLPETSPTALLHWRANLGSIYRDGLTPYRQSATQDRDEEETNDWARLTDCITPALLTRITGETPDHWSLTSASSAKVDIDDIPGLPSSSAAGPLAEKELGFLPIDLKQTWRAGATGRERTHAAQDRSWYLSSLITTYCREDENEVLGELQFCFLMVLTLNNHSCLEQWKRVLGLLFTCISAVGQRPGFFVRAIQTLQLQLRHCGDVEGGCLICGRRGGAVEGLVRRFRKGLEEVEGVGKVDVVDELEELEEYLREEFGWEFEGEFVRRGMLELEDGERVEMEMSGYEEDDESGEYAPMVVELTPAQASALDVGDAGTLSLPERLHKVKRESKSESEESEEAEESEDEQDLDDMDARF
ncbi:hypothetical protein H2199_000288 [Coniosporium tulheliwenetii]|uniref:Uncharacterized protein n=1 Tax=Coniosporium tulheliwenetii TaxID=3383036 RepID=A0ACC2ZPH7_9PEZI|nr:hypothetical protein H2199_000288 [Cladosporium sp. JES 115]